MMIKGIKKIHRYLYIATVLIIFLPTWPLLLVWSRNPEKHYSKFVKTRKIIGFLSSSLVGFFYKVTHEEPVDWSQTYIICPNHSSNLDITATMQSCKTDFSFIGKDDLLNNPVTGLFFRTIDIPINRNSKISSYRAFKRADDYLKKNKSVLIFPEGKIGDEYPPQLCEFKNGPFKLAIEHGVAVLPVVIHNAWTHMWDDGTKYGSKPGLIHIEILKPIQTGNMTVEQADELKKQVFDLIQSKVYLEKHS